MGADAGVICPWTIYEVYGDRRILEQHYPAMKRFVDFCAKRKVLADVEVMPMSGVNEAFARLDRGDVRFRFSLDLKTI